MREGLANPHWQVTSSIAHCFSQKYFLKRFFFHISKILNERLIIVHNSLKTTNYPKAILFKKSSRSYQSSLKFDLYFATQKLPFSPSLKRGWTNRLVTERWLSMTTIL